MSAHDPRYDGVPLTLFYMLSANALAFRSVFFALATYQDGAKYYGVIATAVGVRVASAEGRHVTIREVMRAPMVRTLDLHPAQRRVVSAALSRWAIRQVTRPVGSVLAEA